MGRQMCAIKTKYGSRGNFKPIIKIPTTIATFTLMEIGYKDELKNIIIHNFKLDKV